jgi:membrane-associated protease RseP (regulator of RpoE activity)/DNA-directed RNA polymerase subunit RPC12/RpoP
MPKGIYECVNCGHREVLDSTEPVLEKACPKCGGDMILIGYTTNIGEEPEVRSSEEGTSAPEASEPSLRNAEGFSQTLPAEVEGKLNEFYSLKFQGFEGHVAVFEVLEVYEKNFEKVLRELERFGYWAALKKKDGRVVLFVFPAGKIPPDNPWLPWLFLVLTILSTFFAGYYLALTYIATLDHYGLPGLRNPYLIALSFSISVMAIIGTHELGHKIAATYHGVKATMPYFIPFPNILGTLGAVIRVKSPLPTRDAAIDLGVSGPIAGFLVAIPVTMLGLKLSILVPAHLVPSTSGGIYFGTNLLFEGLEKLVLHIQGDYVIFLHPVAIAGWVGILVTFLNLIPVAQLDGGHILRAFISEKAHRLFTYAVAFLLVGMSYLWSGWLIWAILILLIGAAGNPGALDEVSPVSWKRKLLALIALVIFVLTATPRPLWSA